MMGSKISVIILGVICVEMKCLVSEPAVPAIDGPVAASANFCLCGWCKRCWRDLRGKPVELLK